MPSAIPAGAESASLPAIDHLNGLASPISNRQHPGNFSANIDPASKARLTPLIDWLKESVSYISSIPQLW
ncbi:MAG: hypothetical protein IPL59_19725 [Candidatus Competibacteraceae bacterium]|uniref:hypothetical protein n=1 Tax=Candidatus Contendibacter odensensis TaxID=1400860 RepID=UPI00054E446F|nr:hypothetical protein [Candidatus Contendobacter odensis]MBK8537131.1 hypothetical protein [Candidatus Competibacteraceae bacterium]MBK8755015.1 hypothetical protein [Candidatus Competibacteraceae bacterium]